MVRGRNCLLIFAFCFSLPGSKPSFGAESKWVELIKGVGLSAWRKSTGDWIEVGEVFLKAGDERKLDWKAGKGVLVNGPRGRTVHLVSKLEHGDCEAHIEFMVPKGSNSGVYFMGRYEIQILDSWDSQRNQPKKKVTFGDCGGIYERWVGGRGFEGRAPRVNACLPPGKWQSFDVVFQAPRFDSKGRKIANAKFVRVLHNGVLIHEDEEVSGPTRAALFNDEKPSGPLMLQGDHGPVAYRNVRIRLLPIYKAEELVPGEVLKSVASYKLGMSKKPLYALERKISALPLTAIRLVEKRILKILKDPGATVEGKKFVLRLLRSIGSESCVPVVAPFLRDPKYSHVARLALQGFPYSSVDRVLRESLDKVPDELRIGIINTLADRGDRSCSALLRRYALSDNVDLAEAAIIALGRIGGEEAARILLNLDVRRALRGALGEAILSCASSLKKEGRVALAERLAKKLLSGLFEKRFKDAAKRLLK